MKRHLILILSLLLLLVPNSTIHAEEDNFLIPDNALFYYSKNFILMDQDTGEVLYHRNGYERVAPASITKVVTLITALELMDSKNINDQEMVTFTQDIFTGMNTNASIAGFLIGETVPIRDILYGIIMPSGADATRAISYHLTGDVEGLSNHMNTLVQRLGLENTTFSNTSGLDSPNLYSTPYELAKLIQYAMKNPSFEQFYTQERYTTTPTRQHPQGISFINYSLVYGKQLSPDTIYGAKSGHTINAERALSSIAKVNGLNLIFVSTNAPQEEIQNTNITDAIQTYKYIKQNYQRITLIEPGDVLETLQVDKGIHNLVVRVNQPISLITPSNINIENISHKVNLKQPISSPLLEGTEIGTLEIYENDKLIQTEILYANESIPTKPIFIALQWIFNAFRLLVVIVALLILTLFAIKISLKHIRRKKRLKRLKQKRSGRN